MQYGTMSPTDTEPLLKWNEHASKHALELLRSRPVGVIGEGTTFSDEKLFEKADIRGVFFPWTLSYRIWWAITALGAIATVFFAPFQIAFQKESGYFNFFSDAIEVTLTSIFVFDILVNFNLVFYKNERIIFERKEIVTTYLQRMFWIDLIGVFPFETVALWASGHLGEDDSTALEFSMLRILGFVRLHRMKKLSDVLQYDARVSLLWFTLLRNFGAVLACTHIEACSMYYLARLHDFGEDTWLGPKVADMTGFDRYVASLYFSITTFATVGYGDWSMSNSRERLMGSVFMLFNVVVAAWVIGSITLLIVKGDEKTGEYRDTLQTLQQYGEMNDFDEHFLKKLKSQLRLEFNNREISDEQVLKNFPSAVRRRILRKLYLKPLVQTDLMNGVRSQFVDAFLASCKVEIFSPGEEIVERGSIMSDLFFLVGGVAEITTPHHTQRRTTTSRAGAPIQRYDSFTDETFDADEHLRTQKLLAGCFIGDIGFFTESPQTYSVLCLTVCKTLTISQAAYKMLAQDHPGSVEKILKNLLAKVQSVQVALPRSLPHLRAGSVFEDIHEDKILDFLVSEDIESGSFISEFEAMKNGNPDPRKLSAYAVSQEQELTAVADLVKMHMEKQLDDQTTRLLFAASRGDTSTISLMCEQGFSPDNADYDNRTALMVAAMKGNTDVVKLLLRYKVRRYEQRRPVNSTHLLSLTLCGSTCR
jgi:CRP-like cAMP-binding protein